jgi:hypothetical protein
MKSLTGGMIAHIAETVTNLCSVWRITRKDGVNFYFTDHDNNIVFNDGDGSQTYVSLYGYDRTAISNEIGLSVDNLDLVGFFNSAAVKEEELRAGLFDYAVVRVSLVNWSDITDGNIKMRKGTLGEVTQTPQGVWRAELRGLAQALSQNIVDLYQPECRTDLGSPQCGVPIKPPVLGRNAAVAVGQHYRVNTLLPTATTWSNLLTNAGFELDTAGAIKTSIVGWTVESGQWGVINGTDSGLAPQAGSQYLYGGSAVAGILSQTVDLERVGVSLASIAGGTCTLAFSIYRALRDINDLGSVRVDYLDANRAIISTPLNTGFITYGPLDTWNLINLASSAIPAATRFIKVTLQHSRVTGTPSDSAFDSCTMSVTDSATAATDSAIYEDRIYQVTTAGTTAGSQPTYNETPAATTNDGTAVLTAVQAWSRSCIITDVIDPANYRIAVNDVRAIDAWFNSGVLVLESGVDRNRVIEVRTFLAAGGVIQLFLPLPLTISPGTKARIYPGCDKRIATCRDRFSNAINFRGEPYVPGQDFQKRTPNAT